MKEDDKMVIPSKGFTHGGKFHSDDVFATAFLRILNPDIKIQRGFEVPEDFDGIVYDIGRGEFDHHQSDKKYRENGCPYAAFGLLWAAYGECVVSAEEAAYFDEKFIQPLDLSDNTGCANTLAQIVDEFNPGWDSYEPYDYGFWRAVDMAEIILKNHFTSVAGIERGRKLVQKAMEESDGRILVLDRFAPWKQEVIGSTYQFVVYPSNRGGYSIQGVAVSREDQSLVCEFPKEWWGAATEDLQKMSGIPTHRFCHPNGFLCAAETLEDAIKVAEYAIANKE
ncbi:MAG: MYG1 family protein [Butyribacter sp.]|nr:MYG1 family protein [bacterium]MDY3854703.1 MYG1 family protein [Butyribacter sp.]